MPDSDVCLSVGCVNDEVLDADPDSYVPRACKYVAWLLCPLFYTIESSELKARGLRYLKSCLSPDECCEPRTVETHVRIRRGVDVLLPDLSQS